MDGRLAASKERIPACVAVSIVVYYICSKNKTMRKMLLKKFPFLFLVVINWSMKNYRKQKTWYPVNTLEPVGGPELCGSPCSPLTQPLTDAGTNRAAKHSVNTARTQHHQKQDKDYECQHKERQPHHIERRELRNISKAK